MWVNERYYCFDCHASGDVIDFVAAYLTVDKLEAARLIANDFAFTVSERARANLTKVKKDANNILDFLSSEGYIVYESGQKMTAKDLYDIYCMWCEDNAFKPLPARNFGMYLIGHQEDYGLEYNNKVTNAQGRRVWGYWGIRPLVTPSS